MNKAYIDQLLEKYWDAESSLAEEQELATYFSKEIIAPEHEQYRPLFEVYGVMRNLTFDEEQETNKKRPQAKVIGLRNWNGLKIMGIAASLLLLITIGIFQVRETSQANHQSYVGKYTVVTEEEEALEITRQALAYLGANFEKSSRTIQMNLKEMEAVSIIK